MKMNKMIFPLVFALAATLATTGCKHGFNKVTPLPGAYAHPPGGDPQPPTLPPGGQMPGDQTPITNTGDKTAIGGGPLSDNWTLDQVTQNRDALAAYTVHFKFDSAAVQDKEQVSIASVGQVLAANANAKLLIEGHCDERGTEEYNRSLGERRALALREALAKSGIDPMRIRTLSFGKDKPADTGHNEAAWAKNRRGEFILCLPK